MLDLRQYKKLAIAGVELKKLEIDGVVVWQSGYTNRVPLSINADGSIYNGGLGYKDGYRIRSGGAEATSVYAMCTGFIPVKGGDIVRISGCDFNWDYSTNTALNVSDGSFTNLGQIVGNAVTGYGVFAEGQSCYEYGKSTVVEEKTGVWKWVVPPTETGVAYIRITAAKGQYVTPNGADLIVTINEEIE